MLDDLTSVTTLAIPGALLLLVMLWAGVRRGARELQLTPERRATLLRTTATLLGGWLVLAFWLGAKGVYQGASGSMLPGLLLGLAVVLPIVIGLTLAAASRTVRDILAVTPPHLLIGVQLYRLLGVVFLVLPAQERIPAEFANPAGWGDVVVGASAPIVAALYYRDAARWHGLAVFWSLFGLADLVVAVTMGVLTAPGDLQRLAFDRPNALVATFPLVLVPTVLVPISILLHLLTLRRLRSEPGKRELAPA